MADWESIEAGLEEVLASAGFELVQFEAATGKGARLVVLADRLDAPGTITVDDCAELSRKISAWLDVEDPFTGPFRLMVSSPGIDRPLNKLSHCERSLGRRVRVKHRTGGTTATVTGRLLAVREQVLVLEVNNEPMEVSWPEIIKANLVFEWADDE